MCPVRIENNEMPSKAAFLAPISTRFQVQKKCNSSSKLTPLACAANRQLDSTRTRDAAVDPEKIKTTGELPSTLIGTTVLHNIPSLPPHIPTSLAHPLDGDGYILAISFQETGAPWVRGRFVRTKPFMAEAKAGRRLFRGSYGTPGSTGWDAPLKPKAASASGAFLWGRGKKRRAFAWGTRALPIALDVATLVSKGPTALGAALTDSPELASERATELVAQPVSYGDSFFLAGVGRAQNGRVLGAFVVEIDRDYKVRSRVPKVQLPSSCKVADFAVGDKFYVLLLHRVMQRSGVGVFGTLLGRKQQVENAPPIDVGFGTEIMLLPRDGSTAASVRLPGEILCSIAGLEGDSGRELSLSLLSIQGHSEKLETISTSTVADIQRGVLSGLTELNQGQLRINLNKLSIAGVSNKLRVIESVLVEPLGNTSILSVATFAAGSTTKLQESVFTTYDHSSETYGLAVANLGTNSIDVQGSWCAEKDFNVGIPLMHHDNQHVCVLVTADDPTKAQARLMTFKINSIQDGPVHVVELSGDEFGLIQGSVGGVWEAEAVEWSKEGSKPVKSAYEIFDSRQWNDIESGFSSLGLGQ